MLSRVLIFRFQPKTVLISVLALCVTVIAAVSAYDVYWSFKTQDVLQETELNPIGRWLIAADGGDIALFMTCKMLGVVAVILAIPAIYWFRVSWGLTCGVSVAVFQGLLYCYLDHGHLL